MAKQSPFPMQPVNLHSPGAGEARSQKEPYTGKPTARPAGKPGFSSALVNLRRFLPCRLPCHRSKPEDLRLRFLRHGGIYRSDVGPYLNPSPGWSNGLPPVHSNPSPRTRREDHALLIVPMSSGRLFLDRVGRHQSPSPLHRHAHSNMRFSDTTEKGTFSLCGEGGHFHFALTSTSSPRDRQD